MCPGDQGGGRGRSWEAGPGGRRGYGREAGLGPGCRAWSVDRDVVGGRIGHGKLGAGWEAGLGLEGRGGWLVKIGVNGRDRLVVTWAPRFVRNLFPKITFLASPFAILRSIFAVF